MAWIEKTRTGLRMVDRVKVNGKIKRISVPLDRDTPQARRKAMEALNEKAAATDQPISAMAIADAIDEYINGKDCRKSTKQVNTTILKRVKVILGPDTQLSALTPGSVSRAFRLSDMPAHRLNQTICLFKTFSKWLYDFEYTTEDIGSRVRKVKDNRPEKKPEDLYLEPDRLRDLLDQLQGMAFYVTKFLALTGLRIGEASALLPEDIGDKYITIDKSYCLLNGEITPPKTKTSNRQIYIQPELQDLINEYMKWRKLDIMAYGIRPKTFFYSRRGGTYSERLYNRSLPSGIHPHMLRHTHVALLAEQGVSLEAIARRLGHDGTDVTRKVYYHVTEKQKEKDEAVIAKVRIL